MPDQGVVALTAPDLVVPGVLGADIVVARAGVILTLGKKMECSLASGV